MDVSDIEDIRSCTSPTTSEDLSEESLSLQAWTSVPSNVEDLSDESTSNAVKPPERTTKPRRPHFLQRLCFREIGGHPSTTPHITRPGFHQMRLQDILPESVLFSHVFLGLSKCGQFLLSYTYTTELDVISFNTVFKYRLHWWAFSPHQKVRKVSEVMLFGNQGIYSTLYIAVSQWPNDYSRVLIYGNGFDSYLGLVSQAERSYLTITTVPSLNKCPGCLKVAASYEEEDLAASWDSCVRFSCLQHSLTVHTTFDVVSPYPKFDPTVCMKRDGTVVFNTGNFLHVLRVELEHVGIGALAVRCDVKPDATFPWAEREDSNSRMAKDGEYRALESHQVPHNPCPCNIRSHTTSPIDYREGANDSCFPNATSHSTSDQIIDTNKYTRIINDDEDDDCMDGSEEVLPFKDIIETKKIDINRCSDSNSIKPIASQNRKFFKVNVNKSVGNNCNRCNKLNIAQGEDKITDKHLTVAKHTIGCVCFNCKKICDITKHCFCSGTDVELESKPSNDKTSEDCLVDEEGEGRKSPWWDFGEVNVSLGRLRDYRAQMRESRIMDSTQELNISCGASSASSEGTLSSVTMLSPVPKSLMVGTTTDEVRSEEERRKGDVRLSTPPRLKRARCGATVKLSSPLPSLPSTPPPSRKHSKMAAEAEKAYEFTEDVPDETGCEKLSSFRRRRLADKKYEFCEEEGEDAENIVPYRLHRRRESFTRLRSPPIHLPPSPLIVNHRRRHHETDTPEVIVSGPRSPANPLSTDVYPLMHPEQDKIVLRPLNQNTGSMLLSPRDRDAVKTAGNKKVSQPEVVAPLEDTPAPPRVDIGTEPADNSPARCTVQLKRRYIEVDDELISVITDIEDDDLNEGTGYHCALPLEVHGAGYVQLQMISNSKAEKLMAPCVLVLQRSFDIEQFCHEIAERLCEESGKKYWFCNDYDVEIVDVCPLSGDVIALAMMRIQATVKTKGLAKSQRHPVSSQQRQQYQGGCRFVWNLDTGRYSVVDTNPLAEVDQYTVEKDPWNPAREMARTLRDKLPQVPAFRPVRYISNRPALKGVSLEKITDLENMIELVL